MLTVLVAGTAYDQSDNGWSKDFLVSAPWPPLDWACVDVPGGSLNYVEVFSLLMRVSRGTGGRWSDRAKAAYKSWQDYIIAVKGKMRQRVTLSTQSESSASVKALTMLRRFGAMSCTIA